MPGLWKTFNGRGAIEAFHKGNFAKARYSCTWTIDSVSMVDNLVRPWEVSGKVELHPLVLMFVILGGIQVFGFLGLFLGPVIVSGSVWQLGISPVRGHRDSAAAANPPPAPLPGPAARPGVAPALADPAQA